MELPRPSTTSVLTTLTQRQLSLRRLLKTLKPLQLINLVPLRTLDKVKSQEALTLFTDTRTTQPYGMLASASLAKRLAPNWLQTQIWDAAISLTALTLLEDQRINTAALVSQLFALMFHLRFGALLLTTRTTVMSQKQSI